MSFDEVLPPPVLVSVRSAAEGVRAVDEPVDAAELAGLLVAARDTRRA